MNNDEVEIIKTLDNNNYEQMYVSDKEETVPKRQSGKSIGDYIKSAKNMIYKVFKYFY